MLNDALIDALSAAEALGKREVAADALALSEDVTDARSLPLPLAERLAVLA